MDVVIARVNRTSALWQLFEFMSDVIVVSSDRSACYYEEVPLDYVHESDFGKNGSYFTITLEYGAGHDQFDPFDISVSRISQTDVEHSHQGRYLHPVVRHYQCRKLLTQHHVTENLENDWTGAATHLDPLRAFFEKEMNGGKLTVPATV